MTDFAFTLLSLETLAAIKADACAALRNPERTRDIVIEAREMVWAVDSELDRRIRWADEVRAILAATV